MMHLIGRLLGIDDLESIERMHLAFAAAWAQAYPLLVLLLAGLLAAGAVVFYRRWQPSIHSRLLRLTLAAMRALLLALLLVLLAEPVIALATTQRYRPLLVLLFDATESMLIRDQAPGSNAAPGSNTAPGSDAASGSQPWAAEPSPTRADLLREAIVGEDARVLRRLEERFRVRAYIMDRPEEAREVVTAGEAESRIDAKQLAEAIDPVGEVSAYGSAFEDLHRRHQSHRLAGVVVFGDFVQNAGPPALAAAQRVGRPFYTVGLGPKQVTDLAVTMRTPALLKQGENIDLPVRLTQTGLEGRPAKLKLTARRITGPAGESLEEPAAPVGEPISVLLEGEDLSVPVPFRPREAGRYLLEARVEPLEHEAVSENNRVTRQVIVRDQSLRLLFLEYQPTWEWRFIKEVFHRDPLVGEAGFRTFLRSASLKVRRDNPLFLETLIRPRSEFFAYDVIFLSDVPAEMLSQELQEMLHEYVSQFGGGLVVIAGPQFGPQAWAGTRLADMLPVVPDPKANRRDQAFELVRTAAADEHDFMRLGSNEPENQRAWDNLGPVPWYQPVARAHPLATVLAAHPIDTTADGQQPQPIIATRQYGRGEVIYFGFNETWRLRKLYGETYYRQLWGQLIYRLGLGRALGEGKRFIVRTDRPRYRSGDKVIASVEAYDRDFSELGADRLEGRLLLEPADGGQTQTISELVLPLARDGVVYETTLPVFAAGRYRMLVTDPVTGHESETSFQVSNVSIERRNPTRDTARQNALAQQTGGKALELDELDQLPDLIDAQQVRITTRRQVPLGNTWLILVLALGLMFGEWLIRKLSNLR